MPRNYNNYDPVEADINDYLDREDREPEMELSRCIDCGRYFSREVGLVIAPKRCAIHDRAVWAAPVFRRSA